MDNNNQLNLTAPILNEMDIVTKNQLNILIQLAEADKHFAKAERELILRIARDKGFPEDIVTQLISNPMPIESLSALSQEQKYEYLYTCVDLIFADHNVLISEIVFSKNIAIKLGFKKDVIDYFVPNYGKKTRQEIRSIVLRNYV